MYNVDSNKFNNSIVSFVEELIYNTTMFFMIGRGWRVRQI